MRRGDLVKVAGDMTKRVSASGQMMIGRSNRLDPDFMAGFVVTRKNSTTVTVSAGYTCDRFAGATFFAELDVTIAGEAYLFAKYLRASGWELVSSHVVQQASSLPADDADYIIHPIAFIQWWGDSEKVGAVTQYGVGNLVGAADGYRAFFAKITDHTTGEYAFTEQAHDGAGVFSDRSGGYSGALGDGAAREASGIAVDLAEDIIVPMVMVPDSGGEETFVFTLAHWLAESTTVLDTDDEFDENETAYVLPRVDNLEVPVFSRVHRDGSKLAVFARTLKFDANGNPVALSAETKVIDCHVIPEGTAQWDVLTWDAVTSRWIPDVVRGHA